LLPASPKKQLKHKIMEKTINPKYDIGQMVNATLMNGKTYKGKIHMIRAEWNPYGASYHYDITMAYDKELDDWYVANICEEQIKPCDEIEDAMQRLAGMSLEDCIKMWNESVDSRKNEIHEMHDEDWWNDLKEDIDGYLFMRHLLQSQTFNITDRFFFYDSENNQFISFSTKQELMELTSKDWFIEELINREEK
jgi:hypothetical protein